MSAGVLVLSPAKLRSFGRLFAVTAQKGLLERILLLWKHMQKHRKPPQ